MFVFSFLRAILKVNRVHIVFMQSVYDYKYLYNSNRKKRNDIQNYTNRIFIYLIFYKTPLFELETILHNSFLSKYRLIIYDVKIESF